VAFHAAGRCAWIANPYRIDSRLPAFPAADFLALFAHPNSKVMAIMTSTLTKSLGVLLAAAVVSASAAKAEDVKYEKCFGVAKAGQNDCQSSTHICAGKSTMDRDPHTFISLPAGTCEKIAGGALTEVGDSKKK
jgi:uncharacterized membrane protein